MELYQLRSFAAVAEAGHLTRAAERLHVSQPALSAQIKALEDELGVALFERGSSGMTLTAAGRQLLPETHRALDAASALRNKAKSIQGGIAGHVRVGTLSQPGFIRLGSFLAQALERYPLVEIELHHGVTGVAFEKVKTGELDASYYYGDLTDPAVASVPLRDVAYRVCAAAAMKDAVVGAEWESLVAQPWILAPPVSSIRSLAQRLFHERGSSPARLVEADNEGVIVSLVKDGIGIALLREDTALEAEERGEICIWNDTRLATTLQFIHLRERAEEPLIRALVEVVEDVWDVVPAEV